MSSSRSVEGLGRVVDALVALRPETLSVTELQASVAGVLPLIDRPVARLMWLSGS